MVGPHEMQCQNSQTGNTAQAAGAYGLKLPALLPHRLLSDVPADWREWSIKWLLLDTDRVQSWSDDHAVFRLESGGYAEMDRESSSTTLHLPASPSAEGLIHPYLATTAAANAAWQGRATLHASAFALDGGAWAVVGDQEDGKSSLVGWAALHGLPVVSDDLVITDGDLVLSGPRCIDLRQPTARRLGIGDNVGRLGRRERWRVDLPAAPAVLPLHGWISLDWGDAPRLERIPMNERMDVVHRNRALRLPLDDLTPLMNILAAPAFRFSRPKDFARMDDAMYFLLDCLGGRPFQRMAG